MVHKVTPQDGQHYLPHIVMENGYALIHYLTILAHAHKHTVQITLSFLFKLENKHTIRSFRLQNHFIF